MTTVLITTDFSAASSYALDYACALLQDQEVTLDLLHIFPIPFNYTTDAIALSAITPAIEQAEQRIQEEVQRIKTAYPSCIIEGHVITGSFLETLQQETRERKASFVILGTAGFSDLYLGDTDPLEALRIVEAPVLFVPYGAKISPIRNIAYACNYAYTGPVTPVAEIKEWVNFTGAALHIIHADKHPENYDEKQSSGAAWLKDAMEPLKPEFTWIQDKDILHGLSSFISSNQVDCVVVVPRKYGLWAGLFHESRTKALARLNKVPVIAFHENTL